jgi:hypothetical protein
MEDTEEINKELELAKNAEYRDKSVQKMVDEQIKTNNILEQISHILSLIYLRKVNEHYGYREKPDKENPLQGLP